VYLRGTWGGGPGPAVAVVGTRRASAYGLGIARVLGETRGAAGVTVVSGLARGIDRAAHAGALRAEGVTVGVLGCGVDVAYPAEHQSLIEEVQKRGVVMAEAPMGTPPRARQFPLDDVTARTGSDSAAVAAAPAGLEVRGLVRQRPGKNFLRRPSLPHTVRGDAGGTTWPNHSSL
jgi:DNA processing protein